MGLVLPSKGKFSPLYAESLDIQRHVREVDTVETSPDPLSVLTTSGPNVLTALAAL